MLFDYLNQKLDQMKFVLVVLKILVFPISFLFGIILFIRNWLYDRKILQSVRPDTVFTINVGNLNLGGTGKTPHVEYLVSLLANQYQSTILSRGYGRKTKGFLLANKQVSAEKIGDEPMQYYMKFANKVRVVVCENRIAGVNQIQEKFPANELIILDDAFQHRKINPHFNILLCDFNAPFYDDFLVPVGKLRDIKRSALRADLVIVTKCPQDILMEKQQEMILKIGQFTNDVPVFFSKIIYQSIKSYSEALFNEKIAATIVTGIAQPEVFEHYLRKKKILIEEVKVFADHYDFSKKDMVKLMAKKENFNHAMQFITTEKDMVKIKPLLNEQELKYFFYVPIAIEIEKEKLFNNLIINELKSFQKSF